MNAIVHHRLFTLASLAGAGLLALTTVAQAAKVDVPTGVMSAASTAAGAPKSDSRKPLPAAVVASANDDTATGVALVSAVIGSVEADKAMLVLNGQPAFWDPQRLKIYKEGSSSGALPISMLRRGLPIRFALEPGSAPDRRIVLIVIGGQP